MAERPEIPGDFLALAEKAHNVSDGWAVAMTWGERRRWRKKQRRVHR